MVISGAVIRLSSIVFTVLFECFIVSMYNLYKESIAILSRKTLIMNISEVTGSFGEENLIFDLTNALNI